VSDDDRDEAARAKKERVLHTRVPAVLEEELKRLATNLKVPVSNLVRVILEDAIDAVDVGVQKAEGELHGIAERLQRQRDSLRAGVQRSTQRAEQAAARTDCPVQSDALEGVLGFQSLVLASEAACTVCGRSLPRGGRACRGVREGAGPKVLVAAGCSLVPEGDE